MKIGKTYTSNPPSILLILSFFCSTCCFAAQVITTDTYIAESDWQYEHTNLLVRGCTLSVDGTHQFGTLQVEDAGMIRQLGTNLTVSALYITHTSRYDLAGGAVLKVFQDLTLTNAASMRVHCTNVYGKIDEQWAGRGGSLQVSGDVYIARSASLSANGTGYRAASNFNQAGIGPGGGSGGNVAGGGGGGYGGFGGDGHGTGGTNYGSALAPLAPGSGGGRGDNGAGTGHGGGAIQLETAGRLTINGTLSADGAHGSPDDAGGGAGGALWLTCDTLAGSGILSARGGNGTPFAGAGGGGRIAVYARTNLFTGYTNCTAAAGTNRAGQAGTLAFFDTSAGAGHYNLFVPSMRFDYPSNTNILLDTLYAGWTDAPSTAVVEVGEGCAFFARNIFLTQGAQWFIGGASTVSVAEAVTLTESNTAIWCGSRDVAAQVDSNWVGKGVALYASNLTLHAHTRITADAQGYRCASALMQAGKGPGGGASGGYGGGGGGGYGSVGMSGSGAGGSTYGSAVIPLDPGSGGGAGDVGSAFNGHGGGAIQLYVSGKMQLDGCITANGGNGSPDDLAGGSGGSILAVVNELSGDGYFMANGGTGTVWAGSGGGGRIAVYYENSSLNSFADSMALNGSGTADGDGTVGFFKVSDRKNYALDPQRVLRVERLFHYETEGDTITLGGIYIGETGSNALLTIAGGSEVLASGAITIDHAGQLLCRARNISNQVNGVWAGEGVKLSCADMLVNTGCTLHADAQGYRCASAFRQNGAGPGGGAQGANVGAGGGGHGGIGGHGSYTYGTGGAAYGLNIQPTTPGSGGGAGDNGAFTGHGGGAIRITATNTLTLHGRISANGADGSSDDIGGGAGGSLWVTANTLSGGGLFEANGGAGTLWAGAGAGGRAAVYYNHSTFEGFTGSTATSGTNRAGEAGTIIFFDTSATPAAAHVYHNYTLTNNETWSCSDLVLHTNAAMRTEGGCRLLMSGDLTLHSGSVLRARCSHRSNLVGGVWSGKGLSIRASNMCVNAGATLTTSGEGYWAAPGFMQDGCGPGGGGRGNRAGGGGGGYGGTGGAGHDGVGGATYGSPTLPMDPGSGGGAGDNGTFTGHGGGALQLVLNNRLTIDGRMEADGADGAPDDSAGGSGGSALISANTIDGTGTISACGGDGTSSAGAGGGGRIAIYYRDAVTLTNLAISAGTSGAYQAKSGTLYITTNATFYLDTANGLSLLHDTVSLQWTIFGVDPSAVRAVLQVSRNGKSITLAEGDDTAAYDWNTQNFADGRYDLRISFYSATTQSIGQASVDVLVKNDAVWHSGTITADETWRSGSVHIIEGPVTVSSGTVTIEPGAVLKFADGAYIDIKAGAVVTANGTETAPVIFTSIYDDTADGDTNMDGDSTVPHPGDWSGFNGSGQFNYNEHTDLRYSKTVHSGTVSSDETWLGSFCHIIEGDLLIPAGLNISVQPGAVIKLASNKTVTVQGTLNLEGTADRPVYVTSIKDDTVGGDTNDDADQTTPAAGDWNSIYMNGGAGAFSHVVFRYGGSQNTPWGMIRTAGDTAIATLNGCELHDSVYEALIAYPGGTITASNTLIRGSMRGVNSDSSGDVRLINCTVYDCDTAIWGHGGTVSLCNTILAFNRQYGIDNILNSPITIRYCNVYNPEGTNYYRNISDQTGTNGNISADPLFQNETNGNFRLNYGSPCIDAGVTTSAPPLDAMGAPRVNDIRTADKHGIPDATGIYADIGMYEFTDTAVSDIDLVPAAISAPAAAVPGDAATISWQVRNRGTAAASGTRRDKILFVPENPSDWDTQQTLTIVTSSATLGPNQSASLSTTVTIPPGTKGNWRIHIMANCRADLFEGANWNNNQAQADAVTMLDVPSISVGSSTGISFQSTAGGSRWFTCLQPAGEDLSLKWQATDTNGSFQLYSGNERMPSVSRFDSRSVGSDAAATLALPAPKTDTLVHLMVTAQDLASDTAVCILSATQMVYALDRIGLASAGNAGWATIPFHGSALSSGTAGILRPASSGADIQAATNLLDNSTLLYARFNLQNAPTGSYHAVLSNGGIERIISNAFTVTTGSGAHLFTSITVPVRARQGRSFSGFVEYGNDGDADLPAPLLTVEGYNSPSISLWPADGTNASHTSFNFLAAAQNSPFPGVLAPGTSYRYEFKAMSMGSASPAYRVLYVGGADQQSMNYALLEDAIEPAVPHALWSNAWNHITSYAGTTRGQYIQSLAAAAARAAAFGLNPTTEQELLEFMIREAFEVVQSPAVHGMIVLNSNAFPIARADIYLRPADGGTNFFTTPSWYDGTFTLGGVSNGTYQLSVEGWLPTNAATVIVTNAAQSLDIGTIILTGQCARLYGNITAGAGGPPLTNATLLLSGLGMTLQGTALSGADGAYEMSDIIPGTYELTVTAPDWLPNPVVELTFTNGQQRALDIALSSAGAAISGMVYDAASQPVTGAMVYASMQDDSGTYGQRSLTTATTDRSGAYRFASLPAGTYLLGVAGTANQSAPLTNAVTIGSSGCTALNLYIQSGLTVTGYVVSAISTQPLASATVTVAMFPRSSVVTTTDSSGRFIFRGLPAGSHQFSAGANGYLSAAVSADPASTVTIPLCENTKVDGYITYASRAIEGLTVSLISRDTAFAATTNTDENGYYVFNSVFTGDWSVAIGNCEHGGASRWRTDFSIAPTNTRQQLSFTSVIYSISGSVRDANGVHLTNTALYLLKGRDELDTCTTDTNGYYTFNAWRTGTVTLLAHSDDGHLFAPQNLTLSNVNTSLNWIAPTGTLHGSVVSQTAQQPISNALVTVRRADTAAPQLLSRQTVSAPDGSFAFYGLADGSYEVDVLADGYAWQRVTTELTNSTAVNITCPAGRTIRGTVSANSQPSLGAVVRLLDANTNCIASVLSDTNGSYAFTSVPTGLFSLVVSAGSCRPTLVNDINMNHFTVQNQSVNLTSDASKTVSGILYDDDGHLAAGATIELVISGIAMRNITSDNNGAFELENRPHCPFELHGYIAGGSAGTASLSGTQTVTNVTIQAGAPLAARLTALQSARRPAPTRKKWSEEVQQILWDIWNGDMGIPDPLFYHNNLGFDENFIFEFIDDVAVPYQNASAAARSCSAVTANYNNAYKWMEQVENNLSAWRDSWNSLKQINSAEVKRYMAVAMQITAKASLLPASISGALPPGLSLFQGLTEMAGSIQENAITAGTAKPNDFGKSELDSASQNINLTLSGIQAFVEGSLNSADDLWQFYYKQMIQAEKLGLTGTAESMKKAMQSTLADAQKLNALKEGGNISKYGGPILDALGLINDIMKLTAEAKAFPDDVKRRGNDYLDKADNYYKTLKYYRNAVNQFNAALNSCKTGDGGNPENPPPSQPAYNGGQTTQDQPVGIDPNDKLTIGFGNAGYFRANDRLYYTIRFENMATAAAPAGVVYVTDTLSTNLDWSTLQLGEIGFNNTTVSVPTGIQQFAQSGITIPTLSNIHVDVQAAFSNQPGTLYWTLTTIDPVTGELPEDPLVGFLPPNNTKDHRGEGYVSFSIAVPTNAADGVIITNTAKIIFDVNAPIWTPSVTNTTDTTAPTSRVHTLPSQSPAQFTLQVSGDDRGGCGIQFYDIYCSRETDDFSLWKSTSTNNSFIFEGEPGVRYSFYSLARDAIGNQEPRKTASDAHTVTEFNVTGLEHLGSSNNQFVLRWQSATNKKYTVKVGTNLTNSFATVASNIPAIPPVNTFTTQVENGSLMLYGIETE